MHTVRLNYGTQDIGGKAYGAAIGGTGFDRADMAFVIMDELVRRDVEDDQLALMHDVCFPTVFMRLWGQT